MAQWCPDTPGEVLVIPRQSLIPLTLGFKGYHAAPQPV